MSTKTCPMCAEDVKAAAQVCRFCGHDFTAGAHSGGGGFLAGLDRARARADMMAGKCPHCRKRVATLGGFGPLPPVCPKCTRDIPR